ncbi:uncharacterized protein LOC128731134 [Anopheles nili]|uniref:uncharacterized protein LOC128731134 n=1 Tax=Anopheles nili TaxID=185578 RepID=UPI00237BB128|nr:uncharacterized protein LOC128731134 [Anopheles nili]
MYRKDHQLVRRLTIYLVGMVLSFQLCNATKITSKSVPAVCLNGKYDRTGKCVCNPGYSEYQGNCFLTSPISSCPPGSIMFGGICREAVPATETFIVVPPLRVTLITPELPDPLDPIYADNDDRDEDDDNDEINSSPIKNKHLNISYEKIVQNDNVINNETTHNTENINNIVVHITRKMVNGAVKSIVIKNNETTVHEEKIESDQDALDSNCTLEAVTTEAPAKDLPCCTIVSPRLCRRQQEKENDPRWVCFHRKQYVCDKVCTAKVMYLRPRHPSFRHPWLVMPPMVNSQFYRRKQYLRTGKIDTSQKAHLPTLKTAVIADCSGCLRGQNRCHPNCYTYDCMHNNSCSFVQQETFCKDKHDYVCILMEEKPSNTTRV